MPHVEIPYPYGKLGSYPHLGPQDAAIWDRFIANNPGKFIRCWYDFRVGDEDAIDANIPQAVAQNWWDLSYWRIDVAAEDREKIYIIEIKPRANAKAIGQADAYAALYEEDEKPAKQVVAVVLTDIATPTLLRVAKNRGVEVWTS